MCWVSFLNPTYCLERAIGQEFPSDYDTLSGLVYAAHKDQILNYVKVFFFWLLFAL